MSERKPCFLHGEAMIVKEGSMPSSVKPLEVKGPYLIIADSEVTGNHHVVDCEAGVTFFEDTDAEKTRYMNAKKPTRVRCLIDNRHDTIELDPGIYKFGIQQEYDYHAEAKRNVAD